MKFPYLACSRGVLCLIVLLILLPGASAFSVTRFTIAPSEVVYPGESVNVSCLIYVASGVAFPSYDDIQLVTELDDPVWHYTVMVNGVENERAPERGKILTIGGFELGYEDEDEVVLKIRLDAKVPATAPEGANKMFLKVQELDARSNVIQSSVVQYDHLIGLPTPTPTPAYGSIGITSNPSGAGVYVDNVMKGITPVKLDAVPNGAHSVLLRLEGYEDYTDSVMVMADARQVNADLVSKTTTPSPASSQPAATVSPGSSGGTMTPSVTSVPVTIAATTGSLAVTTDPMGALVYIDNQAKGVTPATIPGLSAGTHSITLIMDGYQDFKTTTEIVPGTTSEFVTGLQKRKTVPGFTLAGALVAIGLCSALLMRNNKKE